MKLSYEGIQGEYPSQVRHFGQVTLFKHCPQSFDLKWIEYYDSLYDRIDKKPALSNFIYSSEGSSGNLHFRLIRRFPCPDGSEDCFVGETSDDRIVKFYISHDSGFATIEIEPREQGEGDDFD